MNYVLLYEITQGQFEYNECNQEFFITKVLVLPQVYMWLIFFATYITTQNEKVEYMVNRP